MRMYESIGDYRACFYMRGKRDLAPPSIAVYITGGCKDVGFSGTGSLVKI